MCRNCDLIIFICFSSCPAPPAPCDWGSYRNPNPNTYILFGALVGGPDLKGNYLDARDNYQQSEVAIDYNAGFQSAVAGLSRYAFFRSDYNLIFI